MKKIKTAVLCSALAMGIVGAFAFTPKAKVDCTTSGFLYWNGTEALDPNYVDGDCFGQPGACKVHPETLEPCDGSPNQLFVPYLKK
jgi:hypothetical protein